MTILSFRTKLLICAGGVLLVAILVAIGLGVLHRRWYAEGVASAVTDQAKEDKADAKKAEERGDGGYLYRDLLQRSRKPLPR